MAEQSLKKTVIAIRDQLGDLDDINAVGVWDYNESIGNEEGPTIVNTTDLSPDSLWDHPLLGIWDTSKWSGAAYTNSPVPQRVVNPENLFRDHFRDTQFKDTVYTNPSWDTTNYRWEFKLGDEGRTLAIFKNLEPITSILPNLIVEGVSVTVQIDTTNYPAGRQKDIT